MADDASEELLRFWFGELDAEGHADAAHLQRWWTKDPAFDDDLRRRFGAEVEAALAGKREAWRATARGTVAYVLLLDQLTRNIFRGDARAFAGDARARAATEAALAQGLDRALPIAMRSFLYMPLMHAEDLAAQDRAVELFGALALVEGKADDGGASFARRHRDIVARFGRFPHRNAALGRTSTAEERQFLTQPGSSF